MPAHKQVSSEQELVLLELMQENLELAMNRVASHSTALGKQRLAAFWELVASRLNSVGSGTTKEPQKWREYWNERKYAVRKKVLKLRARATGTDGGSHKNGRFQLTVLEKAILCIMGKVVKPSTSRNVPRPQRSPRSPTIIANSPPPPLAPPSPALAPPSPSPLSQAPAWAIELDSRRMEIDNQRLLLHERLASAVERMADAAEANTNLLQSLLEEVKRRPL